MFHYLLNTPNDAGTMVYHGIVTVLLHHSNPLVGIIREACLLISDLITVESYPRDSKRDQIIEFMINSWLKSASNLAPLFSEGMPPQRSLSSSSSADDTRMTSLNSSIIISHAVYVLMLIDHSMQMRMMKLPIQLSLLSSHFRSRKCLILSPLRVIHCPSYNYYSIIHHSNHAHCQL
jgi:hypothetical protein